MNGFRSRWERNPKPVRIFVYAILGIIGVAAMGIVFGYAIQLLWNWLMPALFGLGEISYWQAIGIFVLARLIFGFGTGGSGGSSKSGRHRRARCEEDEPEAKWTEYEAWWEAEGKVAFEKYRENDGADPQERA